MTDQKKEDTRKTDTPKDRFQEEFNALPLDKKFASLFQMEVATLNDAFSYVANSSMKAFEKFGDVISDLGTKIENEAKKATCPPEKDAAPQAPKASAAKPKSAPKRKPGAPRAPKT
jgi:hypothetical protein